MEISSSIFVIIIASICVASFLVFLWQCITLKELYNKNKILSEDNEVKVLEINNLKEQIENYVCENPRISSSVFWETVNKLFDQESVKSLSVNNYDFNEFVYNINDYILDLRTKNVNLLSEKETVTSQKKSSEVRLGRIGENMAPFFESWKYDPNNFRFLGSPIDGISFNEDEIVFIEIKTGRSRLSSNQSNVKKLIENCSVRFETFRIDENGTTTT